MVVSYIAGTGKDIRRALGAYLLFSAARISAYAALGLFVFFLGRYLIEKFLFSFSRYVLLSGGSFVVLTGLLIAAGRKNNLRFCRFLQKNILEKDRKSIIIFGVVIGLLPCLPLLAVFSSILLVSKNWLDTFLLSLSFGIGTSVSPLILPVVFAGSAPALFKDKRCERIISSICGLVIIFLGTQLIVKAF